MSAPWQGPKTQNLNIRITTAEKHELRATANSYGLNITQYLLTLHRRHTGTVKEITLERKSA